jgi:hypothetical protein
MICDQDANRQEITIPKTDITPETADTSQDGIIIKWESMVDTSNVITHRGEVIRAITSKGVTTIILIKAGINNEGVTIKEEVTGKEDTSKEDTTKAGIIRGEDTNKEEDTTREEVIVKVADTIRVVDTTVGDTSKEDINSKEDTSKEDPEEDPICAGHNKADVVIIQGKVFQDL